MMQQYMKELEQVSFNFINFDFIYILDNLKNIK
jgi:hypothetical protein